MYEEVYMGEGFSNGPLDFGSNLIINNTIDNNYGVLKVEENTKVCHRAAKATAYENLFVIQLQYESERIDFRALSGMNVGLHTFVSTAANYLTYQSRTDLEQVYQRIATQECSQNREILKVSEKYSV